MKPQGNWLKISRLQDEMEEELSNGTDMLEEWGKKCYWTLKSRRKKPRKIKMKMARSDPGDHSALERAASLEYDTFDKLTLLDVSYIAPIKSKQEQFSTNNVAPYPNHSWHYQYRCVQKQSENKASQLALNSALLL